jgi:putative copper export protein/methionine-rich copper-binding protein CopC
LFRFLSAALLAAGAVVGGASPAAAHANLVSTEPGYGATLPSGPGRVLIRYDLPVEVKGAQVDLERSGRTLRVGRPVYASPDHKDVSLPLPDLGQGSYVLTWFLFGSDGDVMGAELAFSVLPPAGAGASGPGAQVPPARSIEQRSFVPLSKAQDAARLMASASLIVLVGGVAFVARLWRAGARLRRTRVLLWAALAGALVANAAALGLKGAAVQGQSALGAFSPAALTALNGTHVGRVLVARLGFLLLAVPVVALLTVAPQRALRSHRWWIGAAVSSLGALATHGMLSHAYARGPLASATHIVHLGAVAVWLGGLAMLAVVVLPRRRGEELSLLVPRWSRLAFACVATAAVAGTILLVLISPRWTALPGSGYGRLLLVKLTLVAVLLAAASRSREFVRRRLPALTTGSPGGPEVSPDTVDLAGADAPAELRVPVGVGAAPATPAAPAGTAAGPGPPTRAAAPLAAGVRHGPRPTEDGTVDPVRLRPFVTAVTAELCFAASILAATAVLVGRPPPT